MPFQQPPTIGYHKIRGLGAPLRMMCHYKSQPFKQVSYGADLKEAWFAGAKPKLAESNSVINLPYVIDEGTVITQSITCQLYLGKKLGIDQKKDFIHNHTVLDQVMDLRNDLMKIVYPSCGSVKTKEEFPDAAKKHLEGAKGHFKKLEGFCKGVYMCGDAPQSGDFVLFEMLDEHISICKSVGVENAVADFPKLSALHQKLVAEPSLAKYFASDEHLKWSQNNPLMTHYTGFDGDFEYGKTEEATITMAPNAAEEGGSTKGVGNMLLVYGSGNGENSKSRQVADALVKKLGAEPHVTKDLAVNPPTFVDGNWVQARFNPNATDAQKNATSTKNSDAAVAEYLAADTIVLAAAMYNFNVSACVKAWFDQIAVVGKTFKYGEDGNPQALAGGKKLYVVVATGGVPMGSDMDFLTPYVKQFMGFLGNTDITFIDVSKGNVAGAQEQIDAL